MSRTPFDPMQSAAMRSVDKTPPLTPQAAGSADRPLTISQTNTLLAHALAASLPSTFFIQGEISNFRTYDRGHAFFTMKDPSAELPCILWKDALQRLKFKPKDGLSVIARGTIKLYEPQGRLQLYVETLFPQGAGALELAFRQLCDKLRAEGLFDPARKRPLPHLPRHIALVTSRTGDVLHDVLTTAWRRFPALHISLYPVRVQGDQAAPDIIRALNKLNTYQNHLVTPSPGHLVTNPKYVSESPLPFDLILLVRGGGSLEDLWAFNDESLARTIIASSIPIATGIGHEPDTTIADLVGDLRGPTPTGITELTIPDARALSAELQTQSQILTRDIRRTLTHWQTRLDRTALVLTSVQQKSTRDRRYHLDQLTRKIAAIEPRHAIAQGWRRVEDAEHRLDRASPKHRILRHRDHLTHLHARLNAALQSRLSTAQHQLTAAATQLRAISPQAVLDRGFSITTKKDGTILRSPSQVQKGDLLTTKLAQGEITSTVGKPKQESLF